MKSYLLFLVVLLLHLQGFSKECLCAKKHEMQVVSYPKTYVEADKIAFNNQMIYIRIDDDVVVATPSIHSDREGFFIEKVWRIDTPCPDDPHSWKCARCRNCNPYYKKCCSVCNHDQDDRECDTY